MGSCWTVRSSSEIPLSKNRVLSLASISLLVSFFFNFVLSIFFAHRQDLRLGRIAIPLQWLSDLLATGELGRVAVPILLWVEAHELQKLVHPGRYAVLLPLQKLRDGGDVGGDSAVGEEAYLLDCVSDVAPELRTAHGCVRLAVYQNLAARGFYETVDHTHARCLAATRRTHQNANF